MASMNHPRHRPGSDMLSYMCLETKPGGRLFSDQEIIDHAGFLLFAAHDSTTSTLNHLVYYLAKYAEWQETIRREGAGFGRPFLYYLELDQLVQLKNVFLESQRLHPSVTLMMRHTIRDIELGGHLVPANTNIFLMPMFSHRFERYWRDPDRFDPGRFSAERAERRAHPFCFMPFGGGAHKCIGMHFAAMQAKLFVHQFLRRYQVSLPPGHVARFQTIPLPKLADDLPLVLASRG